MEIIPFLRLSGRRIVVLWVVAGLAGALGAFYAQQLPVRYTGEATVFLERVYPGLRYEREPFVNNYSSAVRFLTPVHERVGGQIGLNAAQVGNGLTIDVPNNSDIAYVRFTADNIDTATAGAEAVATETLITLTNETQIAAQAALDRANAAKAEAQSQVDAITGPFGVVDLQREYEQVDLQVKDLEKQVTTLNPADPATVNVNALLEFRRGQRTQLAAALPAYQTANTRLRTLSEAAIAAQNGFDTAQARVAVAQNGEAVVSQGASPESSMQKMVRFGGAAAIIAAVLVLLGIIAIEAVNRPRRSQRVAPPTPNRPMQNGFPGAPPTNGAQHPVGAGVNRPNP